MAKGEGYSWGLVLHRQCQAYQALPFAGGVLDQPSEIMKIMAWCANVARVAKKKIGDMDAGDTVIYRIVQIKKMAHLSPFEFKKKLSKLLPRRVFLDGGQLNAEYFLDKLGLGLVYEDVMRGLGD